MSSSVCVIGAGIIGLSTARAIQDRIPNVQVTVIAAETSPNTTSDVASGICHPRIEWDPRFELTQRWCKTTFDYLWTIAMNGDSDSGASIVSGYELSNSPIPIDSYVNIVRNLRVLHADELKQFEFNYKHGIFFTTVTLNVTKFLRTLEKEFAGDGGQLRREKVADLHQLAGEFNCIVNCSGVGAGELVNDGEVYPIRGQNMRILAPQIKHFYMLDHELNVIPNDDLIVVGSPYQPDNWDLTVDAQLAEQVWNDNLKQLPMLKDAKIIRHSVGLRPARKSGMIRLETKMLDNGHRPYPIVHNYGHRSAGVTLFRGCAIDAAEMVKEKLFG